MNSILAMSSDNPGEPVRTNEEETALPSPPSALPSPLPPLPQLTRSLTMPPGQLSSRPLNGKKSLQQKKCLYHLLNLH